MYTIVVSIIQIWKLKVREVKWIAKGFTANE